MQGMTGGLEQATTTCEVLFAEVARLQSALRHMNQDDASWDEIFGLEQRIAELELMNAAMREIVLAVATQYADDGHMGAITCKWCGTRLEHGMVSPHDQHTSECLVTKARAISQ